MTNRAIELLAKSDAALRDELSAAFDANRNGGTDRLLADIERAEEQEPERWDGLS